MVKECKLKIRSSLNRNIHFVYNVNFNCMRINGSGKVYIGDNFHSDIECLIITQIHNYDTGSAISYVDTYSLKDVKKEKNKIILILQGTVGAEISKVGYEIAKENCDLNIYFKLHPGEFGRWKREYKYLQEAARLENLHIIEKEIHLYELMATAEFLVGGVYSTAIFEGLALQCKTILLDLPGVEFSGYLVREDIAKVAKSTQEVLEFMKEGDFKKS